MSRSPRKLEEHPPLSAVDARRLEEYSLNASGAFQSLVYDGGGAQRAYLQVTAADVAALALYAHFSFGPPTITGIGARQTCRQRVNPDEQQALARRLGGVADGAALHVGDSGIMHRWAHCRRDYRRGRKLGMVRPRFRQLLQRGQDRDAGRPR